MCSIILQPECGDPDPIFDFTINVSPGQPITGPKTVFTPRNQNEMKILHFTDIHYDPVSSQIFLSLKKLIEINFYRTI